MLHAYQYCSIRLAFVFSTADPFVKDFDKFKNLIEHENMKLQCGVLGYPKPIVSWFKDGVNLMNNNDTESRIKFKESNGFQNSELNIKAVKFDDAGEYKCVAVSPTNSSIKTEKSIVVRVLGTAHCGLLVWFLTSII